MPALYIMEGSNLFVGDHDPTLSKHLTLSEIAIPTLEEMFQDHHPGGSRVQIEVEVGIQKLQSTFKLAGWDPDVLGQFGLGSDARMMFTAYGSIRNKQTGVIVQAMALMEGRLGKIEPNAHSRGELQGHDYAINEILHYELFFDGSEKVYWDFFTTEWRVDGQDRNADERAALNIT